ncbi:MAG: hypothetical protein ACI83W_000957 [Marinoscillum sp.]|jgi:hypothetical protein
MTSMASFSQSTELPFRQIPDDPATYTAETVVARMVEGLAFRYYWATEGLKPEDLSYQPSEGARTSRETLEHIHGLTQVVFNCVNSKAHIAVEVTTWDFEKLRAETLNNLLVASQALRSGNLKLEDLPIRFEGRDSEYPFWNQINGPIEDAVWHVGQVVSFRRASGNPFNSKVSVFNGVVRD